MFLWVEVLNRALAWRDRDGAAEDLVAAGGTWSEREHAATLEDADLLRAVWAARALETPLPAALAAWLAAIRLEPGTVEIWRGFALPAVRARRTGSRLPPAADVLLSTALLELVSGPKVVEVVSRCHGVQRPAGERPSTADAAFAARAALSGLLADGWTQCPRLVHAPRLGRYCSKACSNAAFAARKGRREPRYFAAKQAQYRDRQRRAAAPVRRESAFAFVD